MLACDQDAFEKRVESRSTAQKKFIRGTEAICDSDWAYIGVLSEKPGSGKLINEKPMMFQAVGGTWVERDALRACNGKFGGRLPFQVETGCFLLNIAGTPIGTPIPRS